MKTTLPYTLYPLIGLGDHEIVDALMNGLPLPLRISMALRYCHAFGLFSLRQQEATMREAIKAFLAGDDQVAQEVRGSGFYRGSADDEWYLSHAAPLDRPDYDPLAEMLAEMKEWTP